MMDIDLVFAAIWSLGGNLDEESRHVFDQFMKTTIASQFPSIDFPADNTVYDYYVSLEDKSFHSWMDKLPSFKYEISQPLHKVIIAFPPKRYLCNGIYH